ncbi:MAG: nuclear transport factor 2 family protein [Armatimonadetes bacterium]|nr:nuclear transport factor 2 family protein [Armatimonadota bacterium]
MAAVTTEEMRNTHIIQSLYAAFERGDVQAVLDGLSENVEWVVPGPAEIASAGTRYGRRQVAEFFQILDRELQFEQFEPKEYVAQGDRVVALGYIRARAKSTNRIAEYDWAMAFTLREGKVAIYHGYYDTAALLAAVRNGK